MSWFAAPAEGQMAQNGVFHKGQELPIVLTLIVMGIYVHDQHVVEIARRSLCPRMSECARSVELFDRDTALVLAKHFHPVVSLIATCCQPIHKLSIACIFPL